MNNILGFILFFAVSLSVYIGMHLYTAWWVVRHFAALSAPHVRLYFLLAALFFPLAMTLLHFHHNPVTKILAWLGYLWMGVIFIWLTLAAADDILALLLSFAKIDTKPYCGPAVCVLVVLVSAFAVYSALKTPDVRRIEITMPNLPPKLDGFKIVQISDAHISAMVPFSRFVKLCGTLKELQPDLLVNTGDLVDPGFEAEARLEDLSRQFAPKYGKVAVLGNHEFYFGLSKAIDIYRRCGFTLLRHKSVTLSNGIQIAGVDDVKTSGITPRQIEQLLSGLDQSKPSIYLSHEPVRYDIAAKYGVGLMLSGHTHAGQIFPFTLLVRLRYPHLYGLYKNGEGWHYVTSGTFYWGPPMRLFAPQEIPLFILRSPEK